MPQKTASFSRCAALVALLLIPACGPIIVTEVPNPSPEQLYAAPRSAVTREGLYQPTPHAYTRPDYQIVTDLQGRKVVCFAWTDPVESTEGNHDVMCVNRRTGTVAVADLVDDMQPLSPPIPPRDVYGRPADAIVDGDRTCRRPSIPVEAATNKHNVIGGFMQQVDTATKCRHPSGALSDPLRYVPY